MTRTQEQIIDHKKQIENMSQTKKALVVALAFLIALPLATLILALNLTWLFAGVSVFGVAVGLLIGMTKSAVVSGVLPLLFTFAGGSILALSVGENRSPEQVNILGQVLAGFAIGTVVGLLVGVALRKWQVDLPLGKLWD